MHLLSDIGTLCQLLCVINKAVHGNPCRGRLGRASNELGRGRNDLGRGIYKQP